MVIEKDVQIEKLKNFAMINGVLFKKNAIKDFQANSNTTTLCEIAKIVEGKKRRTLSNIPISGTSKGSPTVEGGNSDLTSDPAVGIMRGETDSISIEAIKITGLKS